MTKRGHCRVERNVELQVIYFEDCDYRIHYHQVWNWVFDVDDEEGEVRTQLQSKIDLPLVYVELLTIVRVEKLNKIQLISKAAD